MDKLFQRYQRQIILPELGESGQQKLLSAKVLIVGAGGLGCPALLYLAAAGIGTIGIIDDDKVSLHNLHRQVLFTVNDIGYPKTEQAKTRLQQLNPDIAINSYAYKLTNENCLQLFKLYDVILDCTDNFPTRYMINDACVLLKKPLVFAAISRFEGQVAIFNIDANNICTNYRDLFPQSPIENEIKNCEETGVIGTLPGIIGSLMANETIKLIAGFGLSLINKMLVMNLLTYQQSMINILPAKMNTIDFPKTELSFKEFDYDFFCSVKNNAGITIDKFLEIKDNYDTLLVDIREFGETPAMLKFKHIRVPLSAIEMNMHEFNKRNIILFCQSGKRSLQAADLLLKKFGKEKNIYSLQNGIADLL